MPLLPARAPSGRISRSAARENEGGASVLLVGDQVHPILLLAAFEGDAPDRQGQLRIDRAGPGELFLVVLLGVQLAGEAGPAAHGFLLGHLDEARAEEAHLLAFLQLDLFEEGAEEGVHEEQGGREAHPHAAHQEFRPLGGLLHRVPVGGGDIPVLFALLADIEDVAHLFLLVALHHDDLVFVALVAGELVGLPLLPFLFAGNGGAGQQDEREGQEASMTIHDFLPIVPTILASARKPGQKERKGLYRPSRRRRMNSARTASRSSGSRILRSIFCRWAGWVKMNSSFSALCGIPVMTLRVTPRRSADSRSVASSDVIRRACFRIP